MSSFQTTVSTIAALSTITVTGITAYKVYDAMQQNNVKQQLIIQDLKQQLVQKQTQPIAPPVQVQTQPVTPTVVYQPLPLPSTQQPRTIPAPTTNTQQ